MYFSFLSTGKYRRKIKQKRNVVTITTLSIIPFFDKLNLSKSIVIHKFKQIDF